MIFRENVAFFIVLLKLSGAFNCNFTKDFIIKTNLGQIKGALKYTIDKNESFLAFQGIRYAEPPPRFEISRPAKPWSGILEAIDGPPYCLQYNKGDIFGIEDCLFLNVYVPLKRPNNKLLPVMVYIHGGGYARGYSGYDTYKPDYFLEQEVVFVTMNYRLGVLGFLALENMEVPGNNGLKDQVLALKWIKKNIVDFGGDPSKITIFGESSGSAAVSYHLLSSTTKGLFQQAIMESSNCLETKHLTTNPKQKATILAKQLAIENTEPKNILRAFKNINAKSLLLASNSDYFFDKTSFGVRIGFSFGPVVEPKHDDAFFYGKSYELFKSGKFHRIPIMTGYNSLEGLEFLEFVSDFQTLFINNLSSLIPIDVNIKTDDQVQGAAKKIKHYYFPNGFKTSNFDFEIVKFLSEDVFSRPLYKMVQLMSLYTTVYYYRFDYMGNLGGFTGSKFPGVTHTEELGYLFLKNPFGKTNYPPNSADILTRKRMIIMWTNFGKSGNPTPKKIALLENKIWPKASSNVKDLNYFNINESLSVSQNPDEKSNIFWNNFYKTYGNRPFTTY